MTPEAKLREAELLAAATKKSEARRLVGEVLAVDETNLAAWQLLAKLAKNTQEEIHCLRRILHLDPTQTWAEQRLRQLSTAPLQKITRPFTPPPIPRPTHPVHSQPNRRPSKSRIDSATLFFAVAGLIFAVICLFIVVVLRNPPTAESPLLDSQTPRTTLIGNPIPGTSGNRCETLIQRALQSTVEDCNRLGPSQACYGNKTVRAHLAAGSSGRFALPGDIIDIDSLLSIDVSPLDLDSNDWGIAVFKLVADLPRTLPGQNVTFIVFGNTSLTDASGDLQAFYFANRLGELACESIPFDGILMNMPEGSGLSVSANGSDLTLLGMASLQALADDKMTVSVLQGSASITADGQTQYFGAGQQVQVPLGGENGLAPAGPPSAPIDLAPEALAVSCTLAGTNCNPSELQPVSADEAQQAIAQVISATPSPTRLPTLTHTPTLTSSPTASPSPSATLTPTDTETPTATDTASATSTPSATFTPTATPTVTASPTPPTWILGAFVVFGQEGIWLEANSIVNSGSLGANLSSPGPYLSDNEEVVLGDNVRVASASARVAGDSLNLRGGVQVFDVFYNTITGNGTVGGTRSSPLTLPLVSVLPPVPAFTPGTQDITVNNNQTLTLDPGNYNQLLAHNGSTITFTGGVYNFDSWDVRENVNLYFAAPAEIRIASKMDTDMFTYLGPAPNSGLSAQDIRLFVTGLNGNNGALSSTPKAAEIGRFNTVLINIFVPNGTLWVRQGTNATGAFIARWVHVGLSVQLNLDSGF